MIGWLTKSLFRRLLFSYLITVLLGVGVVGFFVSFFNKEHIYETAQRELLRKAKNVNLAIQEVPAITEKELDILAFLDQSFDARIWVFDREGKITATSLKDEVFIGKSVASSIVDKVLQGNEVINELEFKGLTKPMLSVVVPWGKKDQVYGGIVLHAPIEGIDRTLGYLRETVLWATLIGILISTAMVSYLSWSIARPLRKIDKTAMEIGSGNYSQRVHVESTDEIGDLAQTINKLAEKLEQVELDRLKAESVRSDFLANVSHELRTPLTAMQGFLEALQDGLVEEEARQKYYLVMYQETLHMSRLVDDLMDLVKLENGEVTLFKTPVDIGEILHKVAFAFRQEAEGKNTSITVEVANDLPKAHADKHRATQIVKNLVKNAVKFTENGKIRISAVKENGYIHLKVSDTGIGIAEEDIGRIWERFFKGDRVRSRTNTGSGLGLSIVRELVGLHDGKIIVSSELGKGTEFSVWLPSIESSQSGLGS
ncbi:sensor histidine kinase [Effusibacillus lacus]|uniref:histidine kinase n=1 Tax=Effusibacillus lacus TaxID=1348429 RepID=A0A292YNH0_9BACL|nr:HAMP domain-containing sensor histidine kinase [Effusibacillus lacus]TCS76529.1 signal transduction histidine kinase [Effusibacillus lacus]GAX90449.1 two-component sensor histidine kinase [Effusibacillus lacus]